MPTPQKKIHVDRARHANEWDEEGYFGPCFASHSSFGVDESNRPVCEWTCCGGVGLQVKCSARRHTSSANMVQVRSTTTKPACQGAHCHECIQELQVSLFPEAKHTVVVQLTSDIWAFWITISFRFDPAIMLNFLEVLTKVVYLTEPPLLLVWWVRVRHQGIQLLTVVWWRARSWDKWQCWPW